MRPPERTKTGWDYGNGVTDPDADGWHYGGKPKSGGDGRKLVTLEQGGMVWVGIRMWTSAHERWVNNGEPINERVIAWRDIPEPAQYRWVHGRLT